MNFSSFWSDVAATVLGGFLLTLLFFGAKEKLFPLPSITGRWYFQMVTTESAYNPYTGMILGYVTMLWREGYRIEGTVEKMYENSSTGERAYTGKNRTRGIVRGYIEKNYFGRDKLFLHVTEDGHGRESSNFYELTALRDGTLSGKFSSMVANQVGTVKWQRTAF
ncbi:MAG: hypothetical protein ACYCZH_06705 [Sulfuriferula sp.]